MPTKKRRVDFYEITMGDENLPNSIFSILQEMMQKDEEWRTFASTTRKFYTLESVTSDISVPNCYRVIFESADVGYRPPVKDGLTLERRENPRKTSEGETDRTHLLFVEKSERVYLLKEHHGRGITEGQLRQFIRSKIKDLFKEKEADLTVNFSMDYLPNAGFLEELNRTKRIYIGQLVTSKTVLSSSPIAYANISNDVKSDIEIKLKAKKGKNIIEVIRQAFASTQGSDPIIKSIVIKGENDMGNPVKLDTSFMKKFDHVDVEINDSTGIVNSTNIFSNLMAFVEHL